MRYRKKCALLYLIVDLHSLVIFRLLKHDISLCFGAGHKELTDVQVLSNLCETNIKIFVSLLIPLKLCSLPDHSPCNSNGIKSEVVIFTRRPV